MGGGEIAFYQAENLRGGGNLDGWPSRGISPFAIFCVKQEGGGVCKSIDLPGRTEFSLPWYCCTSPGIWRNKLSLGGEQALKNKTNKQTNKRVGIMRLVSYYQSFSECGRFELRSSSLRGKCSLRQLLIPFLTILYQYKPLLPSPGWNLYCSTTSISYVEATSFKGKN